MTAHDAPEFIDGSHRGTTAPATARPSRPGPGSWLAFVLIGICAAAWVRNEHIVVWLMSQGIVQETATSALLGAVTWASVAGGILGLIVVRPIVTWTASPIYRWGPFQAVVAYLKEALRPVVNTLLAAGNAIPLALTRVLGLLLRYLRLVASSVLRPLWLGVSAIAQVAGLAFIYAWVRVFTGLRLLSLGVSAIAQVAGLAFTYAWVRVFTGLRLLSLSVSAVAQVAGLALRYVWVRLFTGLRLLSLGVSAIAQVAGLALRYVVVRVFTGLRLLSLSVSAVAQVAGLALRYAWLGVSTVAQVIALVLGYVWQRVSIVFRYTWTGVATLARVVALVLRYLWMGVSMALGHMRTGVSAVAHAGGRSSAVMLVYTEGVARAGATESRHAWFAATHTVAKAFVAVLSYGEDVVAAIARAGAVVAGYLRLGFTAALSYLWMAVSAAGGYLWLRVAAVARLVALVLGHGRLGVAIAVSYLWLATSTVLRYTWRRVSTALRYLWLGVAIALRYLWLATSTVLRYTWLGASIALRFLWLGVAIALGYLWLATSTVLRYLWLGVAIALSYLWLATSTVLRYLWLGVAITLSYLWLATSTVLRYTLLAVYTALRYVWIGVSTVAQSVALLMRYAWMGVSAAAQVVAVALRYLCLGVAFALRYLWLATSTVLRYTWLRVSTALRYLRLGVAIALRYLWLATSTVLRYTWLGTSTALRYLWLSVAAVAQVAALALRFLWMGTSTGLRYVWMGVSAFAQVVGLALRPVWMGVSIALRYVWLGVSTVVQAVIWVLGYLLLGASAVRRQLSLGVSTGALVIRWTLGYLWQGVLIILQGLVTSLVFAMRTVWTAITAVPDVSRMGASVVKHRKGVSSMSEFNMTRERLLSLVVTTLVAFTISAAVVRVLWPAPPEPTVVVTHWVTGHLYFGAKLPDIAAQFNQAVHRTDSGERIVVEIYNAPSSEGARDLLSRATGVGAVQQDLGGTKRQLPDPTIVTPSGAHWLVRVNHEAGRKIVDPDAARSIARAYIGIVTYREMAECLGWPHKELGYADILELRADPRGWKKYDCAKPSWGESPLVAYTDPRTSSTGRSVLFALYAIASGKPPERLTLADVNDPDVVDYVKNFQGLIDHYFIGTTVMNTKIYQGPRFGHFFIMPEDNLIHLKEGTARAIVRMKKVTAPPIKRPMVMIYPKEGSMVRSNCACIVNADWVTEGQVEAAEKWIDYILEDEQQRRFMAAGFRPTAGLAVTDPSSKITGEFGLDMTKPTKELNPALIAPEVAAAIDRAWEDVKRPGIVTFVVDTSGSMLGTKLKETKDGIDRALDAMASNNQVGFISFDDKINSRIPVEPLEGNDYLIDEAVHKMRARGETALYDAIKKGIEMTDAAEGEADAIRAVVVLTDGRANRCQTRLDELIRMESSKNEKPILRFGGCEGGPSAKDEDGTRVETEDIIGTELAMDTKHAIQIFFIGIGDDADLEVGRMLAEATGAEFQGVTQEDLANLLEEFSGYF